MTKYRKKPVVIEAIQYTGNNGALISNWAMRLGTAGGRVVVESPILEPTPHNETGAYLQIYTLGGVTTAVVGDWIIEGTKGEFYPIKDDIFRETYEAVEDTEKI